MGLSEKPMLIRCVIRRININNLKFQYIYRNTLNRSVVGCVSAVNNHYRKVLSLHCIKYNTASYPTIILKRNMAATTWSMGPGTLDVPLSLFAKNRNRLAEKLKSGQVVVLQGGEDLNFYDTDVQYVFRQVCSLQAFISC